MCQNADKLQPLDKEYENEKKKKKNIVQVWLDDNYMVSCISPRYELMTFGSPDVGGVEGEAVVEHGGGVPTHAHHQQPCPQHPDPEQPHHLPDEGLSAHTHILTHALQAHRCLFLVSHHLYSGIEGNRLMKAAKRYSSSL